MRQVRLGRGRQNRRVGGEPPTPEAPILAGGKHVVVIGGGDTASDCIGTAFRQGALSALTNPKAILFFAAFLPQFIDPARSLVLQFAIMAGTFAAIEIVFEAFVASLSQRIRPWLQRVGRRFNQVCGGIFMAIGAVLSLRA